MDGAGNVHGQAIKATIHQLTESTYAALLTCDKANAGTLAYIGDPAVEVTRWHQLVTSGGGSIRTFVACLGADWVAF